MKMMINDDDNEELILWTGCTAGGRRDLFLAGTIFVSYISYSIYTIIQATNLIRHK